MQFIQRKRRRAPTVIIVSLIDVLMVVLIFLMVTTTFKRQPAVKIILPQSKEGKEGASEGNLVVTVAPQSPYLYLGAKPVTIDGLRTELRAALKSNPQAVLSINGDGKAPWQEVVNVMDVAREVGIATRALIRRPGKS
ncbi:MAG: biopolymer transporter ExbD [Verrucomicrobia bacterium]|nr:biopolymer transporter ExbD [Verrucomicrobiota bacterium]